MNSDFDFDDPFFVIAMNAYIRESKKIMDEPKSEDVKRDAYRVHDRLMREK